MTINRERHRDAFIAITGASSGIGRATALRLAAEGARLALLALPSPDLESVTKECGGSIAIAMDVSKAADVELAFAHMAAEGQLTGLFNNAGTSMVVPFVETSDEQWQRLIAVNLTGCFLVSRAAARLFLNSGRGAIVNMASELALMGQRGYAAYSATKGGILAMTRAMAAEFGRSGIRVNAICPGAIDTSLLQAEFAVADDPGIERQQTEQGIVMGRLGQATEIAAAVSFMLSDEASYMNGAHLVVDGGRTSGFP
jgi:NAD(P)-dependent dehydrogenase (short-subunit alcohol dehydrogenase family)